MAKNLMTVLAWGTVIDRSVLVSSKTDAIQAMFKDIGDSAGRVVVIDDSNTFFTSQNMLKLIEANDDRYKLVAEQAGITISDIEVAAMQRAVELRAEIVAKMTPPVPPYKFADVPDGWSVDTHLTVTKTRIARSRPNTHGDGTSYHLPVSATMKVWAVASKFWANTSSADRLYVDRSRYDQEEARIYVDQVQVGCQRIRRYELEQLALHMGWEFPTPKAS